MKCQPEESLLSAVFLLMVSAPPIKDAYIVIRGSIIVYVVSRAPDYFANSRNRIIDISSCTALPDFVDSLSMPAKMLQEKSL